MIEVMKAIRAKAVADATLIGASMLNGTHVYQESADVDTDAITTGWIVIRALAPVTDPEVPMISEGYDVAIYARTADRADQIAERWQALFEWRHGVAGTGTLGAITGRRLAMPIVFDPPAPGVVSEDSAGKLYIRFRQMRVATFAA